MAPFDSLWNFEDPAGTETAFQSLLSEQGAEMPEPLRAELLSQIARALGLQRRFDDAHVVLDQAMDLAGDDHLAQARCLLERGRVYNSSGHKEKAIVYFERALEKADDAARDPDARKLEPEGRQADFYAVDALHMLAIASPPDEQMEWHRRAIARAESSEHPLTRNWLGSLYNNLGWTLHDSGEYAQALEVFEKALEFRREQGKEGPLRIAQWTVARCLRSLGRVEEALQIQRRLLESGGLTDGFVHEEIAENLLALGRPVEAAPFFAEAHRLLSGDIWLLESEPERLARLHRLAQGQFEASGDAKLRKGV